MSILNMDVLSNGFRQETAGSKRKLDQIGSMPEEAEHVCSQSWVGSLDSKISGSEVRHADNVTTKILFDMIHTCFHQVQSKDREARREQLLCTRWSLKCNRAYVASSSIHGQGVFATRNLGVGEVVTLYPGDAIRYYPVTASGVSESRSGVLFGKHVHANDQDAELLRREFADYQYDVDGYYAVVGLPHLIHDSTYIGHMCNDGAPRAAEIDWAAQYQSVKDDEWYQPSRNNATFKSILDALIAIVATKPIMKDEEVLVTYGEAYWSTRWDHTMV
eukprot:gnl/MRDRNA2_/MRDRNA2_51339_c0_seq1.p1 gnl/MRDRNA2_/MRDRNA2_51339_c0~~gnl/MRDRNA2_/MRDRNA2_51339_c0_seq1.p1  ORF type:complete len:275 (-),score=28.33 gnl/MRDRNA2_/MRDRNA2_51339_c0_seq1:9-833(-)